MTTVILHIDTYKRSDDADLLEIMRDLRFKPSQEIVEKALRNGLYTAVAVTDLEDPERAYMLTQNGGPYASWSRITDGEIRALGGGVLHHDGDDYGYRSMDVGDIVLCGDTPHVCMSIGFEVMPIDRHLFEDLPVINGGKLGDLEEFAPNAPTP